MTSKSVSTNREPLWVTPTISRGRASTVMLRPMIDWSAELPLPVAIADHYALRAARNLICLGEPSPNCRRNVQRLKYAIADFNCTHLLRLSHACNARGSGNPHSHRLECAIVLGVREIHRG